MLIAGGPSKDGEPQGYEDFDRDQRRHTGNIPSLAAGGWISVELRPLPKLLLVPGIRTDLQPQIDSVTLVAPPLGVGISVSDPTASLTVCSTSTRRTRWRVVGAYQLPQHFQLSTRFRYRTGQPTTPIVAATFVSDDDVYAPSFGCVNSRRFSPFYQLDLRLDKRWVFNSWALTTYLDVQNVTARDNGVATAYNFDYSKSGKVNAMPLLPVIGVRADY